MGRLWLTDTDTPRRQKVFRDRAPRRRRARGSFAVRCARIDFPLSAVAVAAKLCTHLLDSAGTVGSFSNKPLSPKSASRPAEPTQTHPTTRDCVETPPQTNPHKAYCHNPLCSAAFQLHLYTVNASTVLSSQLPPPPPPYHMRVHEAVLSQAKCSKSQGAGLVRRGLRDASRAKRHSGCAPVTPDSLFYRRRETAGGRQVSQGISVCGCAARASTKVRITLRRLWFGMSALLSSVAPVFGEVSLVRSHSVMAARS